MAEDDDTFNVIVTNVEYEKMLNDSRQQMSELRTANEKIHSLENQKKAILKQIVELKESINARHIDIQKVTVDCLKLKKDKLSLQETIEDFEDNQQSVLKERDQLKANIERLTSEVKQITDKFQNQMLQTKKLSLTCENLTKNIKYLEQKYQPPKINLTDSWTDTEDLMEGHIHTHKSFSKDYLKKTSGAHQRKSPYHHSTSQQHPPSSLPKKKTISCIKGFQTDKSMPEQNLQLIDSMNDKILGLEMELKKMGVALSEKRLQNEQLVDKQKQTQKDLDDTKLLNQNIGKQLSEADRQFSEVVEKLEIQLEDKEKALVQKDRLCEESKDRVNKRAENLSRQLTIANQFIEKKDLQCSKLKIQQNANSKRIIEFMQQQEASKKTISDLRMRINNKSSDHPNKAPVHFLEKIFNTVKFCTTTKEFDELKDEIQNKLSLQAEYQKLITDADTKNRELQNENAIMKRQLDGSQHMMNEIMDTNLKRDAEAAVLKSDIERLETMLKQAKVTNVETQNRYQIALSELREELRKSQRGQDQLKTIVKMMESKDDYIQYYVNMLRTKLKEEEPRVITRIIHDDLDEFIKKLAKQIPGKTL